MSHAATPVADDCFVCDVPWRDHEPETLFDHTATWLADDTIDSYETLAFLGGVIAQGVITGHMTGEHQVATYLDFYLRVISEALGRRDKIRHLRSGQ